MANLFERIPFLFRYHYPNGRCPHSEEGFEVSSESLDHVLSPTLPKDVLSLRSESISYPESEHCSSVSNSLCSDSLDYQESNLSCSVPSSISSDCLTYQEEKDHLPDKPQTFILCPASLDYRESDLCGSLPEYDCCLRGSQKIDQDSQLPVYSLEEVSYHDTFDDCWIILYDKVYDITRFLQDHPGGEDVLMDYAGRDATISFRSVGHSSEALQAMDDYLVGILPDRQRLFPSDCDERWCIA